MNGHTRSVLTVVAILVLTACSQEGRFDGTGKAFINVDGKVLTLAEFNELFDAFRMDYDSPRAEEDLRQVRAAFLLQLVEEMIILRRAEELGLKVSEAEKTQAIDEIRRSYGTEGFDEIFIRQAVPRLTWEKRLGMQLLINKVIHADLGPRISVEPEDLSTYLKARAKQEETGPRIRAQQILVSSREEAERIRREILDGGDFSDLAQRHSQAPEGVRSGDMGYLAPGDLPEVLEKAVFALDEGEVSDVISSPYGYHVFKVLQKGQVDGLDTDFQLEKAGKVIRRQKLEAAYRPWLDELRTRYKITVNNEMM